MCMMTSRQCRSRVGVLGNLMSKPSGRRRGHLTAHGKSKGTRDCNFLVTNSKSAVYTLFLWTLAIWCLNTIKWMVFCLSELHPTRPEPTLILGRDSSGTLRKGRGYLPCQKHVFRQDNFLKVVGGCPPHQRLKNRRFLVPTIYFCPIWPSFSPFRCHNTVFSPFWWIFFLGSLGFLNVLWITDW